MRARTTPSFEETKSANMQNLHETNKFSKRLPYPLCLSEYMDWHSPVDAPKNLRTPGQELKGTQNWAAGGKN